MSLTEDLAKRAQEDAEEKVLRQGDNIGHQAVDQTKNLVWVVGGLGLLGLGLWYARSRRWI